jgi:S1-C subfamily serine protease
VRREGKELDLTLDLPAGWRRGDISWRATTWDLRRMGLGGLKLAELTGQQREAAKLPGDALALRVEHVGEYGAHAVAKRAGFRKGDVLVAFDGLTGTMSESDLLAYAVQRKRPGDEVAVTVLRDGRRETLRFALQ